MLIIYSTKVSLFFIVGLSDVVGLSMWFPVYTQVQLHHFTCKIINVGSFTTSTACSFHGQISPVWTRMREYRKKHYTALLTCHLLASTFIIGLI